MEYVHVLHFNGVNKWDALIIYQFKCRAFRLVITTVMFSYVNSLTTLMEKSYASYENDVNIISVDNAGETVTNNG